MVPYVENKSIGTDTTAVRAGRIGDSDRVDSKGDISAALSDFSRDIADAMTALGSSVQWITSKMLQYLIGSS